jgi:hypothetical protein
VQSCHRSAGSRAFRQHVWQYLLMSVTALALGSVAVEARAGLAARAVPRTTAAIIPRERDLEGKKRRIP